MKNYILLLYGSFQMKEQILDFISNNLKPNEFLLNQKYVIEKDVNLIFLFSTDIPEQNLSYKLKDILKESEVSFYFLFNLDNVITATVQPELMNFILTGQSNRYYEIVYDLNKPNGNEKTFVVDDILEKINEHGMDSLDDDEKKFLFSLKN